MSYRSIKKLKHCQRGYRTDLRTLQPTTKPLVTQTGVIAKSTTMSQRSSITFRCPPTTGVLSRLTAGPLPGLLTKWPPSERALLGDDLDPGLSPKRGWGSPRSRLLGLLTSRM
jgi:hypothetical protein